MFSGICHVPATDEARSPTFSVLQGREARSPTFSVLQKASMRWGDDHHDKKPLQTSMGLQTSTRLMATQQWDGGLRLTLDGRMRVG